MQEIIFTCSEISHFLMSHTGPLLHYHVYDYCSCNLFCMFGNIFITQIRVLQVSLCILVKI